VAAEGARDVLVYELNAGQMIDDVRLSVPERSRVRAIGGVSIDDSGMRQGALLDVAAIRQRVLAAITEGA
jgi:2-oxoglutarate ferredoxin oxidoreductase subunit alpha